MYIKFKPNSITPSWINKQKLMYVKGFSETLNKQVSGLVPANKRGLIAVIKNSIQRESTLVLDRIPSTGLKGKYFLNAAK